MISEEQSSLWEQRLTEHETSDKSIAAWCKEQSIRVNQFYYWRKRLRLGQVANDRPMKWLPLGLEQSCSGLHSSSRWPGKQVGQDILDLIQVRIL